MENSLNNHRPNWLKHTFDLTPKLNTQTLILIIIFLIAIFSRLYDLGARVMSHDEINHVYFAWQFYKGLEYIHNPITHGPLQFHLLELAFFLINDSDFSARLPSAIFSIASVMFMWKFRRYLTLTGALVAAILFVISPFMLYYGRYARNESIAIFFTIATIWAVLRYLDTGENRFLYYTAMFTAFHFATKETAFIFTAQLLLFLGLLFIYRISQAPWESNTKRTIFLSLLLVVMLLISGAFITNFLLRTELPPVEISSADEPVVLHKIPQVTIILIICAALLFLTAFTLLIINYKWSRLKNERSFGLILFQLTLIFPQLAAFPAFWFKLPLTEYSNMEVVSKISLIATAFLIVSIIAGGLWKKREWLIGAGIYYAIFIVFYTSIFTNLGGLYTGTIGSLGYWLEQQAVERGGQPWFYFILIQLPIYEYLALIGTLIVGAYSILWSFKHTDHSTIQEAPHIEDEITKKLSINYSRRITVALLLFYSSTSILAYMVAGEKMPWLTAHIAWSMLMTTAWLIGKLIERINWKSVFSKDGIISIILIITTLLSIISALLSWIQPIKPFQGKELIQLEATVTFIIFLIVGGISFMGFRKYAFGWEAGQTKKVAFIVFMVILGILTTRSAFIASYINYDQGSEYLVYAHAARGPKDALEQIDSISLRITGGQDLMVAFDNHTAYPFWWYLRNYPNRLEYNDNPSRELRNYPVILVGDLNYHLIEPIVQDDYYSFEYLRMVWPNQDYWNLGIYKQFLTNSETRSKLIYAFYQIWMNRNYQPYAELTDQVITSRNWQPSQSFRMYVRKDIATQIWQYGITQNNTLVSGNIYDEGLIELEPLATIQNIGLSGPKGIAIAPDGSLYIADTGNNRILQISKELKIINQWGSEGINPGEFNQPWGIAIDQNGDVYVADTWNHRIQKFTAGGEFITSWGHYGQGDSVESFWGPRGIAVGPNDEIFISDTGNKRVAIFNSGGAYISEFGSAGYLLGQIDEPVGIAISQKTGKLFLADTWNQRVQIFEEDSESGFFAVYSWDIDGWYGQSLDNKPYLTIDAKDNVILADPEGARIIIFSPNGEFISAFGQYDPFGPTGFGVISNLVADDSGGLWVLDSFKNEIKYFQLPTQ